MEAKDTVMKEKEIALIWAKVHGTRMDASNLIAEAQAEISFKAGYEKGIVVANANNGENMVRQYKAGIKEVVSWLRENNCEPSWKGYDWQAKLKEWGINE